MESANEAPISSHTHLAAVPVETARLCSLLNMTHPHIRPLLAGNYPRIPVLLAHGKFFYAITPHHETQARALRHTDRALRSDFHPRVDDIFVPITAAGRDVAGKSEARQSGHGNVMRAPDSRLQHSAAPNGDGEFTAPFLHSARFGVAADAAELDVDDPAGIQLDGSESVSGVVDAFVEAD